MGEVERDKIWKGKERRETKKRSWEDGKRSRGPAEGRIMRDEHEIRMLCSGSRGRSKRYQRKCKCVKSRGKSCLWSREMMKWRDEAKWTLRALSSAGIEERYPEVETRTTCTAVENGRENRGGKCWGWRKWRKRNWCSGLQRSEML